MWFPYLRFPLSLCHSLDWIVISVDDRNKLFFHRNLFPSLSMWNMVLILVLLNELAESLDIGIW
jgi:hypothetical protein